jgi:hypothetical protein
MISPHQTTFEGIYEGDFLCSWLVSSGIPGVEEWLAEIGVIFKQKIN